MKKFSTLLHQPLHLAHLALQEPVDADLAAVGVEGGGGEAGKRGFTSKFFQKWELLVWIRKACTRIHQMPFAFFYQEMHFYGRKMSFLQY